MDGLDRVGGSGLGISSTLHHSISHSPHLSRAVCVGPARCCASMAPSFSVGFFTMFTMQALFYKMATSEPAKVYCTPDERIDFAEIGRTFRLDPATIMLNGDYIPKTGVDSQSKWKQIKKAFKKEKLPRGVESDPIMVTGEAPVGAVSTKQEEIFKKLNLVIDLMRKSNDMFLRCLFAPTISSEKSENYKRKAISRYICVGEEKASGKLFCSVTGHWFKENVVVACHIYMKKWNALYIGEILGLQVHSSENILFLLDYVKKKFDSFELCVILEGEDTFRTKVLNPAIQSLEIHSDLGKLTFGDLDNQKLLFTTDNRPAKRLCGFRAMLAIKHAEGCGWIDKGAIIVPRDAWASPKFDRKLMTNFLHDVNPEDGLDGSGAATLSCER